MKLVTDIRKEPLLGTVAAVAMGNFDGVHIGHAEVIGRAVRGAAAANLVPVVLTFRPHTARVFAKEFAPPLITTYPRRAALIAALGPSVLIEQVFDDGIAGMTADDFLEGFLVRLVGARAVFVGEDFTYGRGRSGNAEALRAFCNAHGMFVEIVPKVMAGAIAVSSTKIREFILEGNMEGAAKLMGRPYAVEGRVVPGAGRGRGLGFPTVNVAGEWEITPPSGVYVTWLTLRGARLPAAVNIGTNPTFGNGPVTVEAHILGFGGEAYAEEVSIEFVARIRAERRFDSPDALSRQIALDVEVVRRALGVGA
ncbi:MAG: riboflavin biosynthesis protein RibF [Deltaproteobacteria bacterium]|nr:riboflavin biosynthesis protein RibF [Deltaproteobacteria bacterium]